MLMVTYLCGRWESAPSAPPLEMDTTVPPKPHDTPPAGFIHLGGRPYLVARPMTKCAWTLQLKEHVDTTPRRRGDQETSYRFCCDDPRPPP